MEMKCEIPSPDVISKVCHDCGGVLESPVEIGHDDLLCSGGMAVTLYRCYCRVCRSYWLQLGKVNESDEGQATVLAEIVA